MRLNQLYEYSGFVAMAEPQKDFEKLRAEEEDEDNGEVLAELDKESKEFDKARCHMHDTQVE